MRAAVIAPLIACGGGDGGSGCGSTNGVLGRGTFAYDAQFADDGSSCTDTDVFGSSSSVSGCRFAVGSTVRFTYAPRYADASRYTVTAAGDNVAGARGVFDIVQEGLATLLARDEAGNVDDYSRAFTLRAVQRIIAPEAADVALGSDQPAYGVKVLDREDEVLDGKLPLVVTVADATIADCRARGVSNDGRHVYCNTKKRGVTTVDVTLGDKKVTTEIHVSSVAADAAADTSDARGNMDAGDASSDASDAGGDR